MIKTAIVYVAAGFFEIAGCFGLWIWIRESKSGWWLAPGIVSLVLFAGLLTQVDTIAAGRAYAAYGGVYIFASLLWLWVVEHVRPDRWDVRGAQSVSSVQRSSSSGHALPSDLVFRDLCFLVTPLLALLNFKQLEAHISVERASNVRG